MQFFMAEAGTQQPDKKSIKVRRGTMKILMNQYVIIHLASMLRTAAKSFEDNL
jgi:hypothetical protein